MSTLLLAITSALLAAGLPHVSEEFGYRPLLGGDHPSIRRLEHFIDTYEGGFPIYVVWDCGPKRPCQSALDAHSLRMADKLSREIAHIRGVRRVFSPSHATLVTPAENGFALRRLMEHGEVVPDAGDLAARALDDPLWTRRLVAGGGNIGALIVQLDDSRSETMVRVVDGTRAALAAREASGYVFRLAGHPIESVVAGQELAKSTAASTPYTVAIIALIIFLLARSWQAVVVTMATLGLALVWTYGLLGWLGWPQDSLLQVLSTLVVVVGVCDAVHLVSRSGLELAERREDGARARRVGALVAATQAIGPACLVTTLTTAGAFLSFLTSELATFSRFGSIAAFAVLACLLLTFSFLPLLIAALPSRRTARAKQGRGWSALLASVASTAARRRKAILVLAALVAVLGSVGWLAYLRVDTDINEMYGERSQVTQWIRFVDRHLRGLDSLEIDVALPERSPIDTPDTQRRLARFSHFLEATPGLGEATSIQAMITRLNRALHDDDPRFARLPDADASIAEILELLSFEDPSTLGAWLSLDRRHVRISVEGPSDSTAGRGEVLERVRDYARETLPRDWEITLTGPFVMEYDWVTFIENTQISSFLTAFGIVFALMFLFLRSLSLALASMVPAALPVVVTLGTMGLAGLQLDVGRVMIAAVVIGIAVDDSVHILSSYRRRRALGDTPAKAIHDALQEVGRAVVVTSAALALGFLTLLGSAWQTISSFGFFASVAVVCALVASLFVMPALVLVLHREPPAQPGETAGHERDATPRLEATRRSGLHHFLVLLPVVLSLIVAASLALRPEASRGLACRILPNGRVLRVPKLDDACPLRSGDLVESLIATDRPAHEFQGPSTLPQILRDTQVQITARVLRSGKPLVRVLPVERTDSLARAEPVLGAGLASLVLLSIPLMLLRRSRSRAALPLALYYSATCVLFVAAFCGRNAAWLQRFALVAGVTAPAVLAHIGLTFPSERRAVVERPMLLAAPYAVSAVLLVAALFALESNAVIWPFVVYLIAALTVGAWLLLILSCGFAIRESSSPIERARACSATER